MKHRRFSRPQLIAAAVSGLLLVALAVGIFLTRQTQDLRQQAQTGDAGDRASQTAGTIKLVPSPSATGSAHPVGQPVNVDVVFNIYNNPVSAVTARVIIPNTATPPEVTAANLRPAATITNTQGWTCPVGTITSAGTEIHVDISCVTTTLAGFAARGDVKLASFEVTSGAVPPTNPLPLRLDSDLSSISAKDSARLGLSTMLNDSQVGFADPMVSPLPSSPPPSSPPPSSPPPATGSALTLETTFNGVGADRGPIITMVKLGRTGSTSSLYSTVIDFTHQNNDVYQGVLNVPSGVDLSRGRFWITLKGSNHLQRVFRPLDLSTQRQLDLTTKPQLPGDLPPQDGRVDVDDLNKVLEVIAAPAPSAMQLEEADVNFDGVVNAFDMGLILQTLSVRPDEGETP